MQLWGQILARIQEKVSIQNFEIWFKPTSLRGQDLTKKRLFIWVPNKHFKYWLTENYADVLDEVLRELDMSGFEIHFEVAEGNGFEKGADRRGVVVAGEKNGGDGTIGRLNEKYRFDNFVVGFSNQFAHAAAMAVADQPSCAYNPLFIYGGVGLGKTHLMHAIGHKILNASPSISLAYMSSERFMNELIHSIRYDKMIQFREKYRGIDVLLMDDIQFLAGKERTQEEFFHTFNALYDSQKQIIISSDSPPKDIPTLEERLHSRFEWGLIADIQPPDVETKIAILTKKAETQGISIPADVAFFIASNIKSNIRELEGALVRLVAYSSLTGEEISLALAQRVLKNIVESNDRRVTIVDVQKTVSEHYSLKLAELKSKNNSRRVAEPRQVAMHLCKELTEHSLSEIGKEFGGKHHTTVLHAIRKIGDLQKQDPKMRATLDKLTQVIVS